MVKEREGKMTQRIFDIENKKDIQDLWNILPTNIFKIKGMNGQTTYLFEDDFGYKQAQNALKRIGEI